MTISHHYLELTGQIDRSKPETLIEPRYLWTIPHWTWLNMIYPRLKLARTLLSDDGVLLVSINDIEAVSLRLALNEVFGEDELSLSVHLE